jgi:hypothetical protein
MNENTGGYTIKEEFGDVAVFFEGEGNSFSFDVSYKGELVYREGIAGVESTILEKTQGFSVEQKWNYYLEFGRKSADFIEKMTNKQKYTNNEIFGIFHGLAKVVQILKDDYEKTVLRIIQPKPRKSKSQ